MSITSSNNLAVNNSLTVNGNSVLGSSSTTTLLINSTSTNIVQNSGSLSTGSDNVYLNGNVTISNYKTLTTSAGTTTNNGLLQCNNNVYILSGKSLYITYSYLSKYLRHFHDGYNGYIDYTGNFLSFRANGSTTSLSIDSSNNQATFNYNLNTNAIINNSTLTQVGLASFSNDIRVNIGQSIYIINSGLTNFLRMHHSSAAAYIDYTDGLYLRNSTTNSVSPTNTFNINSSTNQGTFNYNLNTTGITNNTNAITNNGVLTQNSIANSNSGLNVSGVPFFSAPQTSLFPTSTSYSSKSGFEIFWNIKTSQGDTAFLNHSAGGSGGFNWWTVGSLHNRINLMYLDDARNLSLLNNISCASLSVTGNITCASLNLTGDVVIGDKLTVEDGLVVNGLNNESKYFTIKGASTYEDDGINTPGYIYSYTKFNGNSASSSSESMQIQTSCRCVKITYSYDTVNGSNTLYKGCTEYVYVKSLYNLVNSWTGYTAWQVGNNNYQPTFSINSSNQLTVNFPINSDNLNALLYWNFAINMI